MAPGTAPFAVTVTTPVILIDGVVQVTPFFSALAPSQVSLYQVNFKVPTLSPGSHTLAIQSGGISSVAVPFPVAPLPFFQYEVSLGSGVYYQQFPDTKNAGHYTTNPRYFSNLTTGQIFTT